MEQRLGRGLDSLISRTIQTDSAGGGGPQEIALEEIRINPNQPRRVLDDAGLEGLAISIENHGVLQPIVVRQVDGGYEIVAGERRYRATRLAGKTSIPATVVDAKGMRSLELALIENIQRENLTPLDEATAYHSLITSSGMTHQELAEQVGKSRTTITNSLRLLELPEDVRDLLAAGDLSAGQARALLGAPDEETMATLASQAVSAGWSVREVEEQVRGDRPVAARKPKGSKKGKKAAEDEPSGKGGAIKNQEHYENELRLRFGTRVQIHDKGGHGDIRLTYYSAEDRDRLLHLLLSMEPED